MGLFKQTIRVVKTTSSYEKRSCNIIGEQVSNKKITLVNLVRTTKNLCAAMKSLKKHTNPITGYSTPPHKEKELEYLYYSKRCFTDLSIKLNRHHKPIHEDMCINTQSDYDYYIAVLNYLYNQVDIGFKPFWFISLHYQHPVEHAKPFKETDKPLGFGDRINFKTCRNIWYETPLYNYWNKQRNDEDQVVKDASKIRNIILKTLYGLKRLNRPDKYEIPNYYFFNEKGKVKLQYHTHIVLPETLYYNSENELNDVFNNYIREKLQCFSKFKTIKVERINSIYDIFGYLNKETKSNFVAFDPFTSNPITPNK